ncbi:MAG: 16S rRNA (cytosine(967)-C(5))-methyltransferase RsmB [Gammaproteobacteria bacterium]|nr:16S rRNA (cytosine(967)-C(5))-methyltransferase RsmB [Gammaproteobacteria bacterium]
MSLSLRHSITQYFSEIAFQGKSANEVVATARKNNHDDIGYIQECLFGTARHFFSLNFILNQLLEKKLAKKHSDLHSLLLTSLYQIEFLSTPDHAVVSESVETARELGKEWACQLVNGVLRNFQRDKKALWLAAENNAEAAAELPNWLIKRLQNAWKGKEKSIYTGLKQKPPLTLRVNQSHPNFSQAFKILEESNIGYAKHPTVSSAIILDTPVPVEAIPQFDQGLFSVQDASAQLAAWLLPLSKGDLVLDACAAPGGKTAHLLERYSVDLIAIDNQQSRAQKIHENLQRIGLNASVLVNDATQWKNNRPFDAILLDAPCSATGVIRRQPDIKLHRTDDDIYPLVKLQRALLDNCWNQLKAGGYLLYATCSLLPDENNKQIKRFCRDNTDAQVVQLDPEFQGLGTVGEFGLQLFPNNSQDGFFYSLLRKTV